VKKRVLIRGPLLTLSGYGVHTRQIFRWLNSRDDFEIKSHVLPWGITPWLLNGKRMNGLVEEIFKTTNLEKLSGFDYSFQIQLPNEWDPKIAKFNVGVTAAVETDRCHPDWISACNKMDHIVVPSEHTKKVLENSGNLSVPITVVPESYPDEIISSSNEPLNLDTKFNFLMSGQITGNNPYNDRKNTFFCLKWLCETFKDDPDVGIVIKTNHGKNTKIDRRLTKNLLKNLLSEVKTGEYPKVYLLHGDLTEKELSDVYKDESVKALVAPSRGEGFGLPLLESAACGLPVIATNWSGHLDFLNKGKFIKLNYKLQPVHETRVDNKIFIEGACWAEVFEEDFKKKVSKFRKASEIPEEWAKDLSKTIREEYSQESISKKYDSLLRDFNK